MDIWLPGDGNIQVFIDKNGVLSVTERVDMAPRPIVPKLGFTDPNEGKNWDARLKGPDPW